jgi:hypothetical protein
MKWHEHGYNVRQSRNTEKYLLVLFITIDTEDRPIKIEPNLKMTRIPQHHTYLLALATLACFLTLVKRIRSALEYLGDSFGANAIRSAVGDGVLACGAAAFLGITDLCQARNVLRLEKRHLE